MPRPDSDPDLARDRPPAPGVTLVDGGAEIAVRAAHATSVSVVLDGDGGDRVVELTDRLYGWWYGFLNDVGPGQRYALRVDGPWRPDAGLRHNPAKLLLDPYARAIDGEVTIQPASFAHKVRHRDWRGDGEIICEEDNSHLMPRAVVVTDDFDWGDDAPPRTPWTGTAIYEAHVKNLTAHHPEVPPRLRGTYAGLGHPATIAHLSQLGITAVELLPIHAFTSETHLVQRGMRNHWGYNTLGYFAPHAAYAAADTPQGVVDEVKAMVRALHAAGIEVILDVVYNHSSEQDVTGPIHGFRGLEASSYYRLDARGADIDVTGCGNTVNTRHPVGCRLALDSLRHWVQTFHIDGFRFDLATALGRGRNLDYDPDHPFLMALRTDPVLSTVKLVAEPWDVGPEGWRTGQFPPPLSEWNDKFRDTVRTFWLADVRAAVAGHTGHGVRDLATRLAGSQDLFGARDRGPLASVNFVSAHDGFTVADLTAYNTKHNEANGEGNRDGADANRSWNHGVEGWSDADEEVLRVRRRSMRNLLATTLLSTGVPMLLSGDEVGRSQGGNNNPYCLDIPAMWNPWDLAGWQEDLLATTRFLLSLRREHPVLRRRTFFNGTAGPGPADVTWHGADGHQLQPHQWEDNAGHILQMYLHGDRLRTRSLLLVLHGGVTTTPIVLPDAVDITTYDLLWDSAWERPEPPRDAVTRWTVGPIPVQPTSLLVLQPTHPDPV